jgi:hypothetical protein
LIVDPPSTMPEYRMSNPGSDRDDPPSPPVKSEPAEELDLPRLDLHLDDEEAEGLEDDEAAIRLADFAGPGDAMDDSYADDISIDVTLDTLEAQESALDDDAEGIDDHAGAGVAFSSKDDEESLLDDRGHAEEGIDFEGSAELGIDPIPREEDDGGLEGLNDVTDKIDEDLFPRLDASEDDDEELEFEVPLAPPPPLDRE